MTDYEETFVQEFLGGLNGVETTIKHKDLAGVKNAGRAILAIMLLNGVNSGVKTKDFSDYVIDTYGESAWFNNRHYAVFALEMIGGEEWSDSVAAAVDRYYDDYDFQKFDEYVIQKLLTKLKERKNGQG